MAKTKKVIHKTTDQTTSKAQKTPRVKKVPVSQQIIIVAKDDQKATVKGSTGTIYNVTPLSCDCKDHTMRKKKCKHMMFVFPV